MREGRGGSRGGGGTAVSGVGRGGDAARGARRLGRVAGQRGARRVWHQAAAAREVGEGAPDGWAPRVRERGRDGGGRRLMGPGGPISARVRVSEFFSFFSFLFYLKI